MLWLTLACNPHDISLGGDSASDSAPPDSADSGGGLPGETGSTVDTSDTGETPWDPGTPNVFVDCNGGADFSTITAAIAASISGTRIGLRPCTYAERVDFTGKYLDIFGIEGPEATIIQGDGRSAVVTAEDGERAGTRLAGVTLSGGGNSNGYGSALRMDGAALLLENVVITGNERSYAVVYGTGSTLELDDVQILDNEIMGGGGVIVLDNGSLLAEKLIVDCGTDGAYALYEHNSTILLDSDLRCSGGYGIATDGGELHARRSRVEGGSIGIWGEDNNDTRNERMWLFNVAAIGRDAGVQASYMHVKADHSVFYGGRIGLELSRAHAESYVTNSAGIGTTCGIRTDGASDLFGWNSLEENGGSCAPDAYLTVGGDPAFVDGADDLRLSAESPLIDAGDADDDAQDRDGSRSDIGVYGGPEGW
ncbi:hypothetical protein LBMAG42_37080 [Deltaproteobacteria bacterium]|nr:hypothetical protein LBMAG42_37080 [Deltaproteobacteria bacterium]